MHDENETNKDDQKTKNNNVNMAKIVIIVISGLFTLLLCYNSHGISSLKFIYKALVYLVVFLGGYFGGYAGLWLNNNFPYPINWLAAKINLQDSMWFKMIGAQVVGVVAGAVLFGGVIAKIMDIKI